MSPKVVAVCFQGLARLSRRVRRRFVRGSREISLAPSLHRASTDALMFSFITMFSGASVHIPFMTGPFLRCVRQYLLCRRAKNSVL